MAEYNCNLIVEWKQADHWNILDSFRFSETLRGRPPVPLLTSYCTHTHTERHLRVCLRQTLLSLLKFLIISYLERLSHLGLFKIKIMQFKVPTLTGWRGYRCLFFRNACIYIAHRLMSAILIPYLPFCCYLFFVVVVYSIQGFSVQMTSLPAVCLWDGAFHWFWSSLIQQD